MGSIVVGIDWDSREPSEFKSFDYEHKALRISAYPLTKELAIFGGEKITVLSKSQWSSDRKLLEDAIVHAYRKPMIMVGPLTLL